VRKAAPLLPQCHGYRELVLDVSKTHTHERNDEPTLRALGHQHAGRPTKRLQTKADAKYRKHTRPFKALNIAFLPVLADTAGRLHEDAVRLLYHAATVEASGNVDDEGLIGREREDHRFGFRRAAIFRRHQAELELLLAALGAQQWHLPDRFSFAIPSSRQS